MAADPNLPSVANPSITFQQQHLDAFGRLRVSNPFTEFDSQFHFDKLPILWDEAAAGGAGAATFNSNEHAVDLTLGTASGEIITRQTRQYFRYQPGKSLFLMFTGVIGAAKTNVRSRIGYFDDDNGLFFEETSSGIGVVKRSSVTGSIVDTRVDQANWNIDPMDGSDPSGVTIDTSNSLIFAVDMEWLGVGRVRFALVIGGRLYYVHEILNSNIITTTYMQTASLPVRYEIENTGTAASGTTLKQICCTVVSEGGFNPLGIIRAVNNTENGAAATAGTLQALVSVRIASANVGATIEAIGYSFISQTVNDDYLIKIFYNPTLTGAVWASVGTDSIAEVDTTAGTGISGGYEIWNAYANDQVAQDIQIQSSIRLGFALDGTPDILTLAVVPRQNSTAMGALNFRELY